MIKLKYTPENYAMPARIRDEPHIMNLHGPRNGYVLLVEDRSDKPLARCKLFNDHTFITQHSYTKYMFFYYCLRNNPTYSEYAYTKTNFDQWVVQMQGLGQHRGGPLEATAILGLHSSPDWSCGSTEAEGCFSIRINKNHSFSIGQKNGLEPLSATKIWFAIPNQIRLIEKDFYPLETYNKQSSTRVVESHADQRDHAQRENKAKPIGSSGFKKAQLASFIQALRSKEDMCHG